MKHVTTSPRRIGEVSPDRHILLPKGRQRYRIVEIGREQVGICPVDDRHNSGVIRLPIDTTVIVEDDQ